MQISSVRVLLAGLLLMTLPATAATLSFAPVMQQGQIGDTIAVDVLAAGLVAGAAPSLGLYNLDITYDGLLLSLANVLYGDPVLGNQLALLGLPSVQAFGPGVGTSVNVFEASLNTEAELNTLQADAFRLFRLEFDAIGTGVSPLTMVVNEFLDASQTNPAPIAIDSAGTASVTIGVIPEPSTFTLIIAGFAAACLTHRRLLAHRKP
jgi:hypothetical protein